VSRQPLVDLARQFEEIRDDVMRAVEAVMASGAFIGGERVRAFEAEFAAFCGREHCIGVANGTDALRLALAGLGVGPGDEVITVANTFVATAEAIAQCGARPVLVDARPDTLLIDVVALEAARSSRTRAVVPVHLYGALADVEAMDAWCARYGVALVEDAAQAHGAARGGRRAGGFGAAAAFSFYPAKNLGAAGDAGAVVTGDPSLARRVRLLADHGQSERYVHEVEGVNSRLDAVQAAVLSIKLRRLHAWNARRRTLAALYRERLTKLAGVSLVAAPLEPDAHVYHLFVVRLPARDAVRRALAAEGIETGLHYPIPIHLQPAFRHLGYGPGDFPVAEAAAREILSLPLYPEMSEDAVEHVCDAIARALA